MEIAVPSRSKQIFLKNQQFASAGKGVTVGAEMAVALDTLVIASYTTEVLW